MKGNNAVIKDMRKLKLGDYESNGETTITRVLNGWIYRCSNGCCFIPESQVNDGPSGQKESK